jgi:hypothetical protein
VGLSGTPVPNSTSVRDLMSKLPMPSGIGVSINVVATEDEPIDYWNEQHE